MTPGKLLLMNMPRASVSERGSSKKNGFEIGLIKLSKQWSLGKNPSSRCPQKQSQSSQQGPKLSPGQPSAGQQLSQGVVEPSSSSPACNETAHNAQTIDQLAHAKRIGHLPGRLLRSQRSRTSAGNGCANAQCVAVAMWVEPTHLIGPRRQNRHAFQDRQTLTEEV